MPEGHTIHRVSRDHLRWYAGECLAVSSPQGRFRSGAKQLNRRLLERVEAYGKHLFYWWDGALLLHIHLGLYGRFRNHRVPPPEPRGAVRLRVIGRRRAFDLNGPAACDVIAPADRDRIVARLGQDPLRKDADPEIAWQRFRRSRSAVGALLLDQSVIAGVGNVFRSDVLFALKIHPERPGRSLDRTEFDRLWETLGRMLKTGVKYNRIITADPAEFGKTAGRMRREERLLVYKKQSCRDCGRIIDAWKLGARTVYACQRCQA
jgi:endonuclease-8